MIMGCAVLLVSCSLVSQAVAAIDKNGDGVPAGSNLGVMEQVFFAEPTAIGVAGAIMIQAVLWFAIGSWEFGLAKRLRDYLRPMEMYQKTIAENYKGDSQIELFGLQEEPAALWIWNWATTMHHGLGGLLMTAGIALDAPWLWRHGMMVEVGGMDIIDFIKMIWCYLLPPGPFPTTKTINPKVNPVMVGLTIFHHSVGMTVGIPVCLFFSDRPDFQWFGLIVMGGPVVFLVFQQAVNTLDSTQPWTQTPKLLVAVYSFVVWSYQRVIYFFPATWGLLQAVARDDRVSTAWTVSFWYGAIAMSLFNLLATAIFVGATVDCCKKYFGKQDGGGLCRVSSVVGGADVAHAVHHTLSSRMQTDMFIAARLVSRAEKAKRAVHEKSEKES